MRLSGGSVLLATCIGLNELCRRSNWTASPSRNIWTVPLGLSVGKVMKIGILPVQVQIGGQYFVARPDGAPEWNVQLQVTPVIPRLIQKPLFK